MSHYTQKEDVGENETLTVEGFESQEVESGVTIYGDFNVFGEATVVENLGFTIFDKGRNIERAESEWDSGMSFAPGSNTYKLVHALLESTRDVDKDLENIYDAVHINSATGAELGQLAQIVDLERKTGETDDKFRARIKAAFRTGNLTATWDEFVEFTLSVLRASVSDVSFATPDPKPAIVEVSADSSVYSNQNLTAQETVDILGGAVPAGHEVQVIEEGTFEVKADGTNDDADKGLTSDTISTGGTLSRDLA